MPKFMRGMSRLPEGDDRILVIIQLSGGNDGLNMVVPFRNDIYYRERPRIAIERETVLPLNDELGLNPMMTRMKELYDAGYVSLINNVGYPNPDRSHFRSMDIWHTASDADEYLNTGWIGRLLDASCPDCAMPYTAIEVDDTLSLALKGSQVSGMAVNNVERLKRHISDPFIQHISAEVSKSELADSDLDYLYKTLIETSESIEYLSAQSKKQAGSASYPGTQLGHELKTISQLILSGTKTRVYYASLTGFDTHVNQKGPQNRLMQVLSDAVGAFVADLRAHDRFKDVMIMTFSEFGRRVKGNASGGTDHGTAGNMFIISGRLKQAGIYNEAPNLADLDDGDLKHSMDFKRVYATVLENWLRADAGVVLNKDLEKLGFA